MSIIWKFIIRNISEKKMRTFLIVFSILVSTALFFAANAISGTMEAFFIEQQKQFIGSADILVRGGEGRSYFPADIAEGYQSRTEYIVPVSQGYGFYRYDEGYDWLTLMGVDYQDLQLWNPIILVNQATLVDFRGSNIILSNEAAARFGISVGEVLALEIADTTYYFQVAALAHSYGPFSGGAETIAVVPRDTLAAIVAEEGMVSTLFIRTSTNMESEILRETMSRGLAGYQVSEAFPYEQMKNWLNSMAAPYQLMVVVVLMLSAYIIYTSFRLIATERLPVVGTFRSIGATRKAASQVLLAESVGYGLLGGVLGAGVGVLVLKLMARMAMPTWAGDVDPGIIFTPGQLVLTIVAAVLLSLLSAALPIHRTGKISVKNVILNISEQVDKDSRWPLYTGLVLLAVALIVPSQTERALLLPVSVLAVFAVIVAMVLLIPWLTVMLARILELVLGVAWGNEGVLASKNLRGNKNMLNSITLLGIGIAVLLMVNITNFTVLGVVADVWQDNVTHDINIRIPGADAELVEAIARIQGVTGVYGICGTGFVAVGDGGRIQWLEGVDPKLHLDYFQLDIDQELMMKLNRGRYMILGNYGAETLGVHVGDSLSIELNGNKNNYKIIALVDTILNNGNYALIGRDWFMSDSNGLFYSEILVKTSEDPDVVARTLEEEFLTHRPTVRTVQWLQAQNHENNAQMFSILQGFSIMTLLIGIVGVVNNLLISFIQRRRSLAVYRSMGMSRAQQVKMIMAEALTSGLVGGLIGVGGGMGLLQIMPYVLLALVGPIGIRYSTTLLIYAFLAGVLVMVVASVAPAMRSSRLNIVEAIKYE